MTSVAAALRQHGPEFLARFGPAIPLGVRKVLSYITRCRTGELGSLLYHCDGCQRRHWIGRSCGNRHCPNCQKQKTTLWLKKQTDKLLPVEHFVVTFTVPEELRLIVRAHRRDGYDAIFAAGAKTIRTLLANDRYLGSDCVGFFGALHTWGRDPLVYHPHVHFVVPGGGLSRDGSKWLQTPSGFLFPHARAIALYKKTFADELRRNGLYEQVPAEAWCGKWVVDIRPVGNGHAVLKYLAPYIYRVAISDNRIEAIDDRSVTYRYTPSGTKQTKSRTVEGWRFVAGFLQHVLPTGFQKIRYYGPLSPNCKRQLENVRWLLWLHKGWTYWLARRSVVNEAVKTSPDVRCTECGHAMRLVQVIGPVDGVVPSVTPSQARAPP